MGGGTVGAWWVPLGTRGEACSDFRGGAEWSILRAEPMPHALSVTSPRTLAVLLSSLVVLACTKDEPKKPEVVATTTPLPDGKDASKLGPPPVVAPPPVSQHTTSVASVTLPSGRTITALQAEADVLGHFAVASASQLLVDVKTQLVPPRYAGFLEEAALRSLVSMALDKRGNLALNYDLAAPLGCALVEPKLEDLKIGCTFGYKGGAKAFATDLGDTNKQADGAGHVAAYAVEGKSVFVDGGAGDVVFVTSGADTFAKTQAYLQRNVVDRAKDIPGDIEVVVYVAAAAERYRSVLEPLFNKLQGGQTPTATGNPPLDAAVKAWTDYSQRSSKTTLDRFGEFAQASLFFSVEPAGVMLGGALFPETGSQMAQDMAAYGESKLDPAYAGLAPGGTLALLAIHVSNAAHTLKSAAESRTMISQVWGALTGKDAAGIEAALTAFQRENSELYDGQTLVALGREEGAVFGMTLAARLQAGKSARESWQAWSAGFTPEAVLGAELSKYVSWKFTQDAAKVDGTPVDRWTIEPGAAVKADLEKQMPADAKAMLDKTLGGLLINVDRAEASGSVIFTIAPKAEAKYMKRALAGFAGNGNVAAQAGLQKALTRDPQTAGVLAVDLKELLGWVRGFSAYGANTASVPQNLGTDLGDFYFTTRYTKDGATVMEYVFSQQLIEQLKPMIPN